MKVWTFVITGGEPVDLDLKRPGPMLRHDGGTTLWKMVGTEEQASIVDALLTGPLIGARVFRTTDRPKNRPKNKP